MYHIDYGLMYSCKVLYKVIGIICNGIGEMQIVSDSQFQYTPNHNEFDKCFVSHVFFLMRCC